MMLTSQTKNKITVTLETDQIAQWTFCFLTGAYTLKAMRSPHSRPPAKWPQDSTTGYHITLQSHSWAYIQRKTWPEKTHVPQYSLQHSLQWPRHGNSLNVHQQRNAQIIQFSQWREMMFIFTDVPFYLFHLTLYIEIVTFLHTVINWAFEYYDSLFTLKSLW